MFQRLEDPAVSRVIISPSELTQLYEAECIKWLAAQPKNTFEAVVTDPPYGMLEYTPDQITKLRAGRGGVWRIPPSLGGHKRMPVPRFTVLDNDHVASLYHFFREFAEVLLPVLVPGAHVFLATNPLLSYTVSQAFVDSGFERRGEIVRLTQTLRGGDRPKNAENEFRDVTVMPRSQPLSTRNGSRCRASRRCRLGQRLSRLPEPVRKVYGIVEPPWVQNRSINVGRHCGDRVTAPRVEQGRRFRYSRRYPGGRSIMRNGKNHNISNDPATSTTVSTLARAICPSEP